MLWFECFCPPQIPMLKPNAPRNGVWRGAIGRRVGQQDRAPLSGISTRMKEISWSSLATCEDTVRGWRRWTRKPALTGHPTHGHLGLDSQPPER